MKLVNEPISLSLAVGKSERRKIALRENTHFLSKQNISCMEELMEHTSRKQMPF